MKQLLKIFTSKNSKAMYYFEVVFSKTVRKICHFVYEELPVLVPRMQQRILQENFCRKPVLNEEMLVNKY